MELRPFGARQALIPLGARPAHDEGEVREPRPLGRRHEREGPIECPGRLPAPSQAPQSQAGEEIRARVPRCGAQEPAGPLVVFLEALLVIENPQQAGGAGVMRGPGRDPRPVVLLRLPQIQLAGVRDLARALAEEVARVVGVPQRLVGVEPEGAAGDEPAVPDGLVSPMIDVSQLACYLRYHRRVTALTRRPQRAVEESLGVQPHESLLEPQPAKLQEISGIAAIDTDGSFQGRARRPALEHVGQIGTRLPGQQHAAAVVGLRQRRRQPDGLLQVLERGRCVASPGVHHGIAHQGIRPGHLITGRSLPQDRRDCAGPEGERG